MTASLELPDGWRAPTRLTIVQHNYGIKHGLVPAGHQVLSQVALEVPLDEITGWQATGILTQMHNVILAMKKAGRPIAGLAAPQIGESVQIIFVPVQSESEKDELYGDFMVVFNPGIEIDETQGQALIGHGCFSSNEVNALLPSPTALTLTGYDRHGAPLRLARAGFHAAVDWHECLHLLGKRAADIAIETSLPIGWRPPELADTYSTWKVAYISNPEATGVWPYPYLEEQWRAVKLGRFLIEKFA